MINKTNYEAFFLLYADGELSAKEKAQVEDFVESHPELEEEFILINATTLDDNEILFPAHASLLRSETTGRSMEETMLLQLDGELHQEEAMELGKELAENASLNAEWNLLLQTKISDEAISFPGKEALYQREKGKLVSGNFFRLAVAALLLGFGFYFGVSYLNNNGTAVVDQPGGIATTTQSQPTNKTEQTTVKLPVTDTQLTAIAQQTPEVSPERSRKQKLDKEESSSQQQMNKLVKNDISNAVPDKSTAVQKAKFTPREIEDNTEVEPVVAGTLTKNKLIIDRDLTPQNNEAIASLAVNNNSESSNTKILYIDSDKLKDTKAGELYDKVKKLVDKTKKVRTGRSLQIANFEIRI